MAQIRRYVNPVPKKVEGSGEYRPYAMKVCCEETQWQQAAELFMQNLVKVTGLERGQGSGISVRRAEGMAEEAYRIEMGDTVCLTASAAVGMNHGLASLLQMAEVQNGQLCFPEVSVEDAPDKEYRGLMLDLARMWHPFEELLDAVDLCWLNKISMLHLHFADDQSYTLPCGSFPKLPSENRHYTREQIGILVEYAHARGVRLMPEIETPGHCTQFQKKYPEIFGSSGVMSCTEKVFGALKSIFAEVAEMFPYSEYIHVGGDEAAIVRWYDCPDSLEYMRAHEIRDIHELYTEFVARSTELVFEVGRRPMVWEGFPAAFNSRVRKDVTVFAWESYYQTAPELLEGGFKVINASWKPLYICAPDNYWSPTEISRWNVYKWQNWWVKSQAYHNDICVPPTEQVIGGQLCVWSDATYVYEDDERAAREEFDLIVPRVAMLAHRTWNAEVKPDSSPFTARMKTGDIMKALRRV